MTSSQRLLALTIMVVLSACADGTRTTAPSDDPLLAPGNKPGGGSGITIVDLGTLGGNSSSAQGINDLNQIVGYSTTAAGATRAFLWNDGALTNLEVLPGMTASQAYAINHSGQVVGSSSNAAGSFRAFVWHGGAMLELAPPSGYCCSEAHSINDNGDVVGAVSVTAGHPHAAIWRDGVPTDLQATGGEGFAWDVNSSGQAVGTSYTSFNDGGPQGSFVWTEADGLQPLGGSLDAGEALAINGGGQIVGWSPPSAGEPLTAYLWDGMKQFLGTLGGPNSVASAISDATPSRPIHVVGWANLRRGHHPFVWTSAGGIKDLGLGKGQSSGVAWDVNSAGWVVGETSGSGGRTRATLWKLP